MFLKKLAKDPARDWRLIAQPPSIRPLLTGSALVADREEKMRILLVEDDNGVRNILAKFLVEEAHSVSVAVNGREGLHLIEEFEPELVISDIKMPEFSGLELIEASRAFSSVPFVMLTGFADTDAAVRALKAGAWYFILKPVNFFELKSIIDRVKDCLTLKQDLAEERVRSIERYSLDEIRSLMEIIAKDMEQPLRKIRLELAPLSANLSALSAEFTAEGFERSAEAGARIMESLVSLEKLIVTLDSESRRLSNLERFLQSPRHPANPSGIETFPLDEALRCAFSLLDSPPETLVFISIEHDIVLAANREQFIRSVVRLMRMAICDDKGAPTRALDISAHREGGELCLLIAGSGQQSNRTGSNRDAAECADEKSENLANVLGYLIERGSIAALGGRLSHRRPESGGIIYTIRMPLPGMNVSAETQRLAESEPSAGRQFKRRISGERG